MNKSLIFSKRNFKELLRNPVLYVFCIGFPLVMLILFAAINSAVPVAQEVFSFPSLIPGIIVFGFGFVSLLLSLLVSKDRSTAFLKRLYASPMRTTDFVVGYAVTGVVVGIAQSIVTMLGGLALSLITGEEYFSFDKACLLAASQFPYLLTSVFVGIGFGSALNDTQAPALTSAFISAGGILSGAWMPLESVPSLKSVCEFLPFYPSVRIGRTITEARYLNDMQTVAYSFDNATVLGILTITIYLILSATFAVISFGKHAKN